MSDLNADRFLEQLEMGQAYRTITDQMGPNPQLLAFVNYDKAHEDNCGLESLDIMVQHQQTLAEITALEDAPFQYIESHDEAMLADANSMFQLTDEFEQLESAFLDIQQNGISTESLGTMQKADLLAGTALASLAVESFEPARADSPESRIALEGLMDKMKEKSAAWAAKILDVVKKIGDVAIAAPAAKVKSALTKLTAKVSDKAHDAGKVIKAHPYATALAAVTSIAATVAAISFIGNKLVPGNTAEAIFAEGEKHFPRLFRSTYLTPKDLVSKKITVKDGNVVRMAVFQNANDGVWVKRTYDDLGWTRTNVIALASKIDALTRDATAAIATFVKNASKFVLGIKSGVATEAYHIPGMSKKMSHRTITSLYWMVYRLVKTKIGGGYYHLAALLLRMAGH